MHEDIIEKIEIPQGVEATVNDALSIKGPKGELSRKFPIEIRKDGNFLVLERKNATKKS